MDKLKCKAMIKYLSTNKWWQCDYMINAQNGYLLTPTPVWWGDRLADHTDRHAYWDRVIDIHQKVIKQTDRWTDRQDIFHCLLPQVLKSSMVKENFKSASIKELD